LKYGEYNSIVINEISYLDVGTTRTYVTNKFSVANFYKTGILLMASEYISGMEGRGATVKLTIT
jgi:hypothetical protein